MKDGKFVEQAKGMERPLALSIDIKNNRIVQIKSQNEDMSTLEENTLNKMSNRIIKNQSINVDVVSGATVSSDGILEATQKAIKDAGGDIHDFEHQVQKEKENSDESDDYSKWIRRPSHIDKVENTDLVIVGSGISGLSAAVQAGYEDIKTIVLEKNGFVGGNGLGVEGMLGAQTAMQKKAGINFSKQEVVENELKTIQYQADGSFWVDLVNNTAENIDWLQKQGVQFDRVDDYHHTCPLPTFHWFKGGRGATGYVPFMEKKAKELGIDIRTSSPVIGLVYENNAVKGVYANVDDQVVQINAKAVVFASGGFGQDKKLVHRQGWNTKNMLFVGMKGSTGDAYKMAMAIGAKDAFDRSAPLITNYIQALPLGNGRDLLAGGPALWVNQDGVRFTDESITDRNAILQSQPFRFIKHGYLVFTRKIFAKYEASLQDLTEEQQKSMQGIDQFAAPDEVRALRILDRSVKENKGNSLYKADTLSDLAEKVGIPVDDFVAQVKRYNQYCQQGEDEEYGKDSKFLVALDEGPYYIARLDQSYAISIGGIGENRHFEVIDDNWNKIPGLYAAGIDSAMQYKEIYTINLGGSCCAHCVNSGRHAVMNATDYIKSLD